MVRHVKYEGHIYIAWGYDEIIGYFLSIHDTRLESETDATSEVNKICSHVSGTGSGAYLHLTTAFGIGETVTQATMFTFMERYGIDPATIQTRPEPKIIQTVTMQAYREETPEMRIDPKYIEARKERLRKHIEELDKSGDIAILE
ncbi:hypothetical protein BGZ70_003638, partial [Mortierella alpina]